MLYNKWTGCWGEVFQIYVKDKTQGTIINDGTTSLSITKETASGWGLVNTNVDLRTCPGRVSAPPDERYDVFWGEVFELWKKP